MTNQSQSMDMGGSGGIHSNLDIIDSDREQSNI